MKKILIQYNFILHYRKAFFNELSRHYEVTVYHSGNKTVTENDKYQEIIVPIKKIGPFYLQSGVLDAVKSDNYDIVIALFDVRWINTVLSIFFNKNSKFIWWGAWITKSKIANFIRLFFTRKSFANVFYTNEARIDFINYGIDDYNLYVANNTFDVGKRIKSYENDLKNSILFVGSLDKRKQNDITITAFNNIINAIPKDINLIIIGDGSERKTLEELVLKLNIEKRVIFKGKITHADKLQEYYKKAIVSISFGQAGLSVLQALGFGVPFLTKTNAISGGEKTNIKHNKNGIFCDDNILSLEENLKYLCNNIGFARDLGENAYQYYSDYCTIENMVQGFLDAIDGTKLANIDENNYKERK
jgi:glycosyltransferase involved in cell wall biosynthesis